ESGLRRIRYEFLEVAAARVGAELIATAHTADDQLETLLLRLLRGSGLRGLGGMRPPSGRWVKPPPGAARADIEADLLAAGVRWREDASNQDLAFARNRIRHNVVPALLWAWQTPVPGTQPGAPPTQSWASVPAGSAPGRSALALRVATLATE